MKFSQRIGKTPISKEIQLDGIDIDLKNQLWNIVKLLYLDLISKNHHNSNSSFRQFAIAIWHHFFKLPIDKIPLYEDKIEAFIRDYFFNSEWYLIYDLIQYLIGLDFNKNKNEQFIEYLNSILESEFSGYRILDNKVAPISNQLEFDELSKSFSITKQYTNLHGANIHLQKALELISDRKNPDYRNSIKESVSSVEATCRMITKENSLGKALKKLESKGLDIDMQLKDGFEKIYSYTNNKENGIRHAIIDNPKETEFEDAKYMLISCSAFINCLIGKAEKSRIKIEAK
jgi:hypothetical protein